MSNREYIQSIHLQIDYQSFLEHFTQAEYSYWNMNSGILKGQMRQTKQGTGDHKHNKYMIRTMANF